MNKHHILLSRGVLVILLLGVGFMYSQSAMVFQQVGKAVAASISQGVQVGQEALPFELTTLQGERVSLADYRGKLVVLNFFATWCYPCQEEMPVIVEMDKRLRDKGGALLAINLTSQEQGKSKAGVKEFLTYFRAEFDPLLDMDGEIMKKYQIIGIPTTIVIDEQGIIVQRINGGLSYSMMEDLILTEE